MPLSFSIACSLIAFVSGVGAVFAAIRSSRLSRQARDNYHASLAELCKFLAHGIDLASRVDEDDPISPALADWARASRRFIQISRAWQASKGRSGNGIESPE
jgi:hypothetical protein